MRRSNHGYILGELATAVFVIGILLAVTTALIVMSNDQVRASHKAFVARQIAVNQLETLKRVPFDELELTAAEGRPLDSELSALLSGELRDFAGAVRVEPFAGDPALKTITVTIRWAEKRRTRELSLSLLRGKRTP
ncbi:MAG: hypothetical protein JW889_00230 [Verrucomicrobia bacterium]|nr:hypothetical protein [Verrucomicrobiota bacterium]